MLSQMANFVLFYSFMISHCIYMPHFFYLLIHHGHFGCSQILVVLSSIAMNIERFAQFLITFCPMCELTYHNTFRLGKITIFLLLKVIDSFVFSYTQQCPGITSVLHLGTIPIGAWNTTWGTRWATCQANALLALLLLYPFQFSHYPISN